MHLVVGAGSVGSAIARILAGRGEQVRIVSRSGSGPRHPLIERAAADASDAGALRSLAPGAVAVYNCVNPPYHRWPELWPPLAASMLAAAEVAGAPLAITGNLYGYGPVDRPMTEDMPLAARTRKGTVRAQMWRDALAAYHDGRIPGATEVRGSDYIGFRDTLLEMAMPAIRAGETVRLHTPLDIPHSFTYTGDMATALATVARDPRAWGRAWHAPSPEPMTIREFVLRAARVDGRPEPMVRRFPELLVRAASLWDPRPREYLEMSYQFKRPFILDSTHTAVTFGLRHTDVDVAIAAALREAEPVSA
jgi:nucleoside-diphosphate-sugar epimerase